MCDFSLEGHASRSARTGDQLVTAELGSHNTIGMVSPDKPDVAVCLMPGSRLKITGGVSESLQSDLRISPTDRATFVKRDMPADHADYRDSLHFDSHTADVTVLLQDLLGGVSFEVLSVPTDQANVPDAPAAARSRELESA